MVPTRGIESHWSWLAWSHPWANHLLEGYGVLIWPDSVMWPPPNKGDGISYTQRRPEGWQWRSDSQKGKLSVVFRNGDECWTGISTTPVLFPTTDSFPLGSQYAPVFSPTATCPAFVHGTLPSSLWRAILIHSSLIQMDFKTHVKPPLFNHCGRQWNFSSVQWESEPHAPAPSSIAVEWGDNLHEMQQLENRA